MAYDIVMAERAKDGVKLVAQRILDVRNAFKDMSEGEMPIADLCDIFAAVRDCFDMIESAKKELGAFKEYLSYTKLPELFEEHKIRTYTTKSGYRVTLSTRISVSILDKAKGYDWLRNNQMGAIITETVNAQTLGASIREMMETKGKEPPSDIFSVKPATYAAVTAVK